MSSSSDTPPETPFRLVRFIYAGKRKRFRSVSRPHEWKDTTMTNGSTKEHEVSTKDASSTKEEPKDKEADKK